jgi:hypothetical protein
MTSTKYQGDELRRLGVRKLRVCGRLDIWLGGRRYLLFGLCVSLDLKEEKGEAYCIH